MTTPTGTPEAPETPETNDDGGSGAYTPPATQEALDAIIKGRLDRERRKFDVSDEIKAKAARLDEIEEANRSDLERLTTRAEAAEAALAAAERSTALRNIADEYGIAKDDLDFIDGPDEDTIRAKAERFAERVATQAADGVTPTDPTPRVGFGLAGGVIPPTGPAADSGDAQAREFFGL